MHSIDIRLDNDEVLEEVQRHIAFLASCGIYGIRLDGPAYYGKVVDGPQRHNGQSVQIAQSIARFASKSKLAVIAQLNCDRWGASYFSSPDYSSIHLTDFAYSALMTLSILTGNVAPLISHLQRVEVTGLRVVRALRTHDGILMKTPLLNGVDRIALSLASRRFNVKPRVIENRDYEINSSFPFLCSLGTDLDGMWNRILLATAVTGSLPGICYLYFPVLFGFQPENHYEIQDSDDPRVLNRQPIPFKVIDEVRQAGRNAQLLKLISLLAEVREGNGLGDRLTDDTVTQVEENGVFIQRRSGGLYLLANFSHHRKLSIPRKLGTPTFDSGVHGKQLMPLGTAVWIR